jgi:hypothetical protein
MLTREEQKRIFDAAQRIANAKLLTQRRLEKSEISKKRAKELVDEREQELLDLLKEVG